MEQVNIEVKRRANIGTSKVKKIKREGLVPGVLYQGDKSEPVVFKEDEISDILRNYGNDVVLNVNYDGKSIKSKIWEVQREPLNDELLHVDLMPIENNEKFIH